MERSIIEIAQSATIVIFDRCPADTLAYRAVDEELREILVDDRLGLGSEVLVAEGSVSVFLRSTFRAR